MVLSYAMDNNIKKYFFLLILLNNLGAYNVYIRMYLERTLNYLTSEKKAIFFKFSLKYVRVGLHFFFFLSFLNFFVRISMLFKCIL